jgi:cysteine desulfuration protein SufE
LSQRATTVREWSEKILKHALVKIMPTVPPLDEVLETFDMLEDWEDRFEYLLDLGKRLPELPESERTEARRVHGCQSQVWLVLESGGDGRVHIRAASDAHIVNGLLTIVLAIFDGKTPGEVLATDAEAVFRTLGLDEHLSGTRRNGLAAVIARVRVMASELEAA